MHRTTGITAESRILSLVPKTKIIALVVLLIKITKIIISKRLVVPLLVKSSRALIAIISKRLALVISKVLVIIVSEALIIVEFLVIVAKTLIAVIIVEPLTKSKTVIVR